MFINLRKSLALLGLTLDQADALDYVIQDLVVLHPDTNEYADAGSVIAARLDDYEFRRCRLAVPEL